MSTSDATAPVILSIESARPAFWQRFPGAVSRRVRHGWTQWVAGPKPPMAAAAVEWLRQTDLGPGMPALAGDNAPSLGVTATAAAALWSYGQRDLVERWLAWVLDQQLPSGAFADCSGRASLSETASVLRALASLDNENLKTTSALARGCDWLASAIDVQGRIHRDEVPNRLPLAADLVCLPPLLTAARRLRENGWEDAVWRTLARFLRSADLTRWETPTPWLAATIDALVELDEEPLARQALVLPAALQRRDGSVPALPATSWVSGEGLARLAEVWFKLGERHRGNQALASLHVRQLACGGFPSGWGRGAPHAERLSVATACHALTAALAQVQSAFAATAEQFEATIDPADGRVAALRQGLAHLPPGARVADVGCGKGRFLRALMPEFPHCRWTGIDLSPAMLDHLPGGAAARQGNLLRLNEPDHYYDAVFAVESLEHSLLPQQAVRELLRIVKPGGRVMIIDKNRSRQSLSIHDPWEQWFSADDVQEWLRAGCEQIEVRSIRHGTNTRPTGLFLCWTARRRGIERAQAA